MRAWLLLAVLIVPLMPVVPATSSCGAGQANDCIENATEWFGKPEWFSNTGATMSAGEPTNCNGETVQRSVWFMVEALSPGSPDIMWLQLDAPFYATLGIYQTNASGGLVQSTCRTSWEDEGLHSPSASVPCTPGIYWIQVGGMNGQSGGFELRDVSVYRKFDLSLSEACPFKATVPTEPRLSTPTGGNGQISLSWVEPWWSGGRGVSISHYRVYRADTCAGNFTLMASPSVRNHADTGLPAGTSRCYKVTAVNFVGEGPAESPRTGTTWSLPNVPTAPSVAKAGKGELALTWGPGSQGAAPLVSYRIHGASDAAGPFTFIASVAASTPSFTDTGLGDGQTRHYRISAVNAVGEGPLGSSGSQTTWATPGAPRDVAVHSQLITTQPGTLEVTWSAPSEATPFTSYRIYRAASGSGATQFIGEVAATKTNFVDNNRGPFLAYHYEVRASNAAGEGAPSARACNVWPIESALGRCA